MELPTFDHEELYWQEGVSLIAGIDEVGMGALAGPVVAGVVVFDEAVETDVVIRDSKTMSEKQRVQAAEWIYENASWAVAEATVDEIEELNIRGAAQLAMRRAVDDLEKAPDMLLIDGTPAQIHKRIPAVNIVGGDSLSFSIAAASIVAKVHRDAIMVKLDKEFPAYGFAGHKGYGAKKHLDALREHGACEHHRASYAPVANLTR